MKPRASEFGLAVQSLQWPLKTWLQYSCLSFGIRRPQWGQPTAAAAIEGALTFVFLSPLLCCRFMSLMCHEVRTPLNGCLASAEMLLETPLKVWVRLPLGFASLTAAKLLA